MNAKRTTTQGSKVFRPSFTREVIVVMITRVRETSVGDVEDVPFLSMHESDRAVRELHLKLKRGLLSASEEVSPYDSSEYVRTYREDIE